jgi:hypothetical protein
VRHTLRHTAISHLVQLGVDLPTVKRVSGHKTLQMVERYSHQNGEHIEAAMDKLERRIGPKAAGNPSLAPLLPTLTRGHERREWARMRF